MKRTLCMLGLALALGAKSRGSFNAWHNSDKWEVVGDAVLSPQNYRRLVGRPGTGVLVNGKDFSAFRMHPKVESMWSIEDGALKSHGLLEELGADLATKKTYKDFVLLVDFRMPTDSDSGIHFRKLIPEMGYFGQTEQMNIGTGRRMGQLESIGFMRANKLKAAQRLQASDIPQVRQVDPEIGQWHTLKITMIGRTLSAELDGQVMIDHYEYPQWLLSTEAEQLRFQKHRYLANERTGKKSPCPIEFRNIFIKEIPEHVAEAAK